MPIQPYLADLLRITDLPPSEPLTVPAVMHLAHAKKVDKHWGEERWLVPEAAPFGFKVIHLHAGHRTSLQFHEQKEEANLILRGAGILYYAPSPREPVQSRPLKAGEIVHIRPGIVHRIEALEDITLVEVSTPQLDDVVRLADDRGRADGRIAAEHAGAGGDAVAGAGAAEHTTEHAGGDDGEV